MRVVQEDTKGSLTMGKAMPAPADQRRALFVREYLVDLNATQAATRAGYSPKTAYEQGSRLLKDAEIAAAVQEAYAARARRTQIDADKVVTELARIAFSDVWNYEIDENGKLVLAEDAPEDATRAVAAVKEKTRFIPQDGGEPITERTVEFKLWDKNTALANLAKHLGMFDTVPQTWVRERLRRTVELLERLPEGERGAVLAELRAIWN